MKNIFILILTLSYNLIFAQIDGNKVEHHGDLVYLKGSTKPYTGHVISWAGDKKAIETDYVDGMIDGIQIL